jgi:hemoglobin
MQWKRRLAPSLLILGILAGCATTGEQVAIEEKSLYDRLGGKPVIIAIVDDFVARIAFDRRIKHFFTNPDATTLKARLIDQICAASGGPCKYTGKDMKTAHQGMDITNTDFDVLVEDLSITLDKFKDNVSKKRRTNSLTPWCLCVKTS